MKIDRAIETTLESLRSHGFKAEFVADREAAKRRLLELIPENATVGIPGSRTVREIGIDVALRDRGNELYDHWREGISPEQSLQCRKAQLTCDVLLTSTNALSQTGELINRDGIGNRAAAMIFGPGKVIVVAGINKIVKRRNNGVKRIKRIAAPIRARELNLDTPCMESGECEDCDHEQRICRATVILERRPSLTDITVIIVGEDLGN